MSVELNDQEVQTTFPVTVAFRDLEPSPSIERYVRRWAAKLVTACDRIDHCHVVIGRPHQHHHHGQRFHVRITLAVPGAPVEVSRDPGVDGAHEELNVAIRDAFRAARRQLKDHASRVRARAAAA